MSKIDLTPERLQKSSTLQLRAICREIGLKPKSTEAKNDLINNILQYCKENPEVLAETSDESAPVTNEKNPITPEDDYRGATIVPNVVINVGDQKAEQVAPVVRPKRMVRAEPAYEPNEDIEPKNDQTDSKESAQPSQEAPRINVRSGILEINPEGFGFLRAQNYRNSTQDTYVSSVKIRYHQLRQGDFIECYSKQVNASKPPAMVEILSVNGRPPETALGRPLFENCIPIYPDEKLKLEVEGKRNDLAMRAIDIIAPIGKGQRAMVVSPPKAGKTTLLKMIANAISANNPEVKIMVLLIDERPEEVTDMQRNINGEVIYSTFDEECDNHIRVAELVLSRAKRLVESGQDVVILLDSLTRLARANNVVAPSSGKTLSGGVDPVSLYFPKKFFGAARNIENGASLTIIATALVDTGSRMDDIVYEEFKGTGNMEIHLDRKLSEKRIFPAIDLLKSGTRKEELLLSQKELEGEYIIRRLLSNGDSQEATESIISMMTRTQTNEDLIKCLNEYLLKVKKDGWRI